MNKILKIEFIVFIIALTLLAGCDSYEDKAISSKESLRINLSLGAFKTDATGKTRATEESNQDGAFNEDKINSLDIFFYKGDVLMWHASSASSDIMYNEKEKQAVIPVKANKYKLFNNNTDNYDIYVVANNKADLSGIAEETTNLETLKNIVFQSDEFAAKGGGEAQTDFLMTGKISKVVNMNNPILGTVDLKRAASKIRLRLLGVNVTGYTQDTSKPVTAKLVHFTDKSALLEGGSFSPTDGADWKETQSKEVNHAPANMTGKTTSAPFYAYANDWNSDPSRETYIILSVPLKNDFTNTTEIYRYHIPIAPNEQTGEAAKYSNKIERNHLYDVEVSVRIPGGLDEGKVELEANYQILDWTTKEILIDIRAMHFLLTSERKVRMANIDSYTLTYISSTPEASIVPGSIKASFTYLNKDGVLAPEDATEDQIPSIVLTPDPENPTIGTIEISSKIPDNFLIKDIKFTITNEKVTDIITIEQFPPIYFTVEKGARSSERPDGKWSQGSGNTDGQNPYMYIITILVPHDGLHIGFPHIDGNGWVTNTGEVSRMISPRFMVASQLGETDANLGYVDSKKHCTSKYYEEVDHSDGTTTKYKGWRLPTEAELRLIDDLQHDPRNKQKLILTNNRYWDNWDSNGAHDMKAPLRWDSNKNDQERASARCVRDIKY